MTVLDEGIQFQVDRHSVLVLGNDGETVFLALHGILPSCIVGLYHPVIRTLTQVGDGHRRCIHLFVNECRRKIRIPGDTKPVPDCIRHGRPRELDVFGRFSRREQRRHVGGRDRRRRPNLLCLFQARLRSLEAHFFPVRQFYSFAITCDFAGTFLHQDLVMVRLGIIPYLRRRFRSQRCSSPVHNDL